MTRKFNLLTLVGLTLIIGLLPSCGGKPKAFFESIFGKSEKKTYSDCIAVDASILPVIDDILPPFYNKTKMGPLYPLELSDKEVFSKLLNQEVYMAFATRRLTKNEENQLKKKKLNPRVYPLAYDALALLVNKENVDSILTIEKFKKILTGEIVSWKEINPDSPYDTIHVAFDHPTSSTVQFCADSILRGQPMKTDGNMTSVLTSAEVVDYVEKHKDALGIVGSLWLDDRRDENSMTFDRDIKVVAVGTTPVFAVQPYQYYIATGEYPFYRTIYAICTDPRGTGPMRRLCNFCWNPGEQGQLIFFRAGLYPARAEYYKREVVVK